ncbi:hypothetical protein AVEN_33139-1 [Araneus ventricosus]|uniref:RNase H type-1 domain-containing protein n=1 Tax=Araneus ventricosus TaxID=182803 RepID=A0A4Y2MPU9_ARAVE|nr:hypothetical protein AVEN_33139-1 [Araneus ventricosus]
MIIERLSDGLRTDLRQLLAINPPNNPTEWLITATNLAKIQRASSYRPISLLPTIGKVLEKLLTQRLNFHLEKNNILNNLQYGFREGRSTEMAITKLLYTIHNGKASGDHVLVFSIDITGAFDNIQHSAIASYLDNSKCPANIINIFKNILQNRKVILNTCEGQRSGTKNEAALKALAVDQPSEIWSQMKYFKKTVQLTPAFKPSQTTFSWITKPRLEFNLSAYKTTSTAALQLILGIPPLHLQLQREARGTAIFRLRIPLSTNVCDIDPSEIEEKATGWSAHPSEHLSPTQISLDDGGNINTGLRIYTYGSKSEKGVGAAFCVLTDVNITHRWSTRLSLRNTVLQAEILALLKAVEYAVALPTQQRTILVDNQACIKLDESPKSHNSIARKIFKLLQSHRHIRVSWIKAQAGYIGNEEADRLTRKAAETENFPETPLEFPKPFIKTFLRQKMLATWQMAWDDGDTGRLIYSIIPKVSLQPMNWARNEFCFSQDMGLSLRFSKDSTLPESHSVLVGESAHQSIMLRFVSSQPPTIWHHPANNISQYGSAA